MEIHSLITLEVLTKICGHSFFLNAEVIAMTIRKRYKNNSVSYSDPCKFCTLSLQLSQISGLDMQERERESGAGSQS